MGKLPAIARGAQEAALRAILLLLASLGLAGTTACNAILGFDEGKPVPAVGGGGVGGSTGGSGGSSGQLISQDLLVRYFLDDGAPGETPQQATDSAAPPLLPLTIDYGEEFTDAGQLFNVSWTEVAGNRGLGWQQSHGPGQASTPISDTKVTHALENTRSLSIELVTQLEGDPSDSRLLYLGESGTSWLALRANDATELELHRMSDPAVIGRWQVGLLERQVLHMVIDTARTDANERVRLFVAGAEIASTGATPPSLNESLDIAHGLLILGNDSGWRSIQGTLFYAALYQRPLTPAEITNNVAVLAEHDDSPQ